MCRVILFITVYYFCSSIFYLGPISKACALSGNSTYSNKYYHEMPAEAPAKEKTQKKEVGNDLLVISGKSGDPVTCSLLDDKKFHCDQYNKADHSELRTGFIKNYLAGSEKTIQYAYFLNDTGRLLTECQINIKKINDKPDINNCKARKDIKIPVKITSGKVLSSVNTLLLIAEDSEVYQCGYDPKNKISGCYPAGLKNLSATNAAFNSLYNKIYLYSANTNKVYSCNFSIDSDSIEKCSPLDLNTGFPDNNIQQITSAPDGQHILLNEKSSLHYCNIDKKKMEINNCMNVYDNFYNIISLTYSRNNDNILYVLDGDIIKSCYLDDTEVHCSKIELNNNIKLIAANKISSTTIFTFLSVKVTNKGGYLLTASYTTLFNSDKKTNIREENNLRLNNSKNLLIKGGAGLELHAMAGRTKCFIVDAPGEIHCNRSTMNMACYYNNSSKNIINKPCPSSLYKTSCTPDIFNYVKTSGNAETTCYRWSIDYKKKEVTADCYIDYFSVDGCTKYNALPCDYIQQAMQHDEKIANKSGKLTIE